MHKKTGLPIKTTLAGILLLVCTLAYAGEKVIAANAWVRPTVPGQEVTGAFMTLQSKAHAKLIKVESPAAEIVEMHSMSMHNNVMEMRQVDRIDLPAGETVKLAPGGFHIMLINVKKPLKRGDTVPLKLTILNDDKSTSITNVRATVGNKK